MVGWIFAAGVALLLVGLGRHAAWWRAGRPAPVAPLRGLLRYPRTFLVDVHDVVARDRYAATMHVPTAAGLSAGILLVVVVHVLGFDGRLPAYALLLALAALVAGSLLVGWRRLSGRPGRLSGGAFDRLWPSLVLFAAFFAVVTLPATGLVPAWAWPPLVAAVVLGLGLLACLDVVGGFSVGPLKHALFGSLHLIFHPRPGRFDKGRIDSALKELDLTAPKLGVESAPDFDWNQLLGFDACVQCGRCQDACPAYAAGLPLNPKKLIQDLAAAMRPRASDRGYAGNPHPGRPVGRAAGGRDRPIIGSMVDADTLWACTTCRACVYECPMMIEHVDAVIGLRRFETLEKGATPGKAAAALDDLRGADNPGGLPAARRVDWATDLGLPLMAERGEAEVLLWLGDGAFDLRHQRTLRALVALLRRAEVDFAVLGGEELDCGDVARRLGDEATFQDLARRTIRLLEGYRFRRILTADPHVLHCLRNEYPAFGGRFEVVHHVSFLADLVAAGRLAVGAADGVGPVAFHDPCYLGRYNGEIEAPRTLMRALGGRVVELERSGLRSACCGWGGGAALTDVAGERRIPDLRMDHVRAAGAETVAVACPNCAVMLEGAVQPRPDVADIAELVLAAVEDGR